MKNSAIWISCSVLLAIAIHFAAHLPLGWTMFAVVFGWPLVGTLVTLDDDLAGGWSNPDGAVPPPWRQSPFWGEVILRGAIALSGFAIEGGSAATSFWVTVIIGSILGAGIMFRGHINQHDG
jgi:hypothetical protein